MVRGGFPDSQSGGFGSTARMETSWTLPAVLGRSSSPIIAGVGWLFFHEPERSRPPGVLCRWEPKQGPLLAKPGIGEVQRVTRLDVDAARESYSVRATRAFWPAGIVTITRRRSRHGGSCAQSQEGADAQDSAVLIGKDSPSRNAWPG